MSIVSLLPHEFLINKTIQRPVFLKELLVVRKINAREDSFEEIFAFVFIYSFLKCEFLLFSRLSIGCRRRSNLLWYSTKGAASGARRCNITVKLRLLLSLWLCITSVPLKLGSWWLFIFAQEAIMYTGWTLIGHHSLLVHWLFVARF